MADSFHFSVNVISIGKGKSVVASAAYISGEGGKKKVSKKQIDENVCLDMECGTQGITILK